MHVSNEDLVDFAHTQFATRVHELMLSRFSGVEYPDFGIHLDC